MLNENTSGSGILSNSWSASLSIPGLEYPVKIKFQEKIVFTVIFSNTWRAVPRFPFLKWVLMILFDEMAGWEFLVLVLGL